MTVGLEYAKICIYLSILVLTLSESIVAAIPKYVAQTISHRAHRFCVEHSPIGDPVTIFLVPKDITIITCGRLILATNCRKTDILLDLPSDQGALIGHSGHVFDDKSS